MYQGHPSASDLSKVFIVTDSERAELMLVTEEARAALKIWTEESQRVLSVTDWTHWPRSSGASTEVHFKVADVRSFRIVAS